MDDPGSGAAVPPSARGTPVRRLRVLVVDDDADSLEVLVAEIAQLGHSSVGASDGTDALQQQQARAFDVILSDWKMPGVSGLELCRRVRWLESSDYTYFVIMTAFGDRAHLLEGLRAGADDYLTKPIDQEELEVRLFSAARVVAYHSELTERNIALREEGKLSFQAARIDPLTQVSNRLRLREDLEALYSRVERYGYRFCAALCDVDLFKQYNDRYGHIAGDEALCHVATAIRKALRQGDTLYRYGGEEFLVILSEQGLDEARQAMDRVRVAVQNLQILHHASQAAVVTISVGVAEVASNGCSRDNWLHLADEALYRAKRNGRNRVEEQHLVRDAVEPNPPNDLLRSSLTSR